MEWPLKYNEKSRVQSFDHNNLMAISYTKLMHQKTPYRSIIFY